MSNYEWEKQYTKQRINSRLKEAELHRQAVAGRQSPDQAPRHPRRNPLASLRRAIRRLIPARRRLSDS